MADNRGRSCNLGSHSRILVATPAGSPALVQVSNLDGTVVSSGVDNHKVDVDNVSTTATAGGDSDTNCEVEGQGRQDPHSLKSLEIPESAFKGLDLKAQLQMLFKKDKVLMR